MKIQPSLLRKFLSTHFEVVQTNDKNEVRINSIRERDTKFHVYINVEKGLFTDFKGNYSGSVVSLIAEYLEIPKNQVPIFLIKEYASKDMPMFEEEEDEEEVKTKLVLPDGIRNFTTESIFRKKPYNYLASRGFSENVINKLGYIYCDGSIFHQRIFIPFYENSQVVYFIARDYTGTSKRRYVNPSGCDSKDYVYNIDNIEDEVVICEGVLDALSLENQVATATLSADLGRQQAIKILDKNPKRIIMVPDNDETGEKKLQRNIDLLYQYKPPSIRFELGIFYLPKGIKDLNEMKVKTGKDFIDFNECEKVKKFKFEYKRKALEW